MTQNQIIMQADDVDDIRYVLGACLTLLQAQDFIEGQRALNSVRPSPLTQDVERIKNRVDFVFSDFVLNRHDLDLALAELEEEEVGSDDPEASESLAEGSDEELSGAPLGSPQVSRQKGRRLSAEELDPDERSN